MKSHLRMICFAFSCILACMSDARAQAEGRRLALVIGISAYDTLPRLNESLDDAWAVGEVLKEKAGFDVTRIMDATSASLRRQVADFAGEVQAGDVVVIYYAGHGVQSSGRNYLIPSDYPDDASLLTTLALSANELLEAIGSKRPLIKLLILDACRNSPLSGVVNTGLAQMEPAAFGAGTRIEFAASSGQAATDGLFAKHLVNELVRPGLDVDDVFRNVRASVASASHGLQTTMSASQLTVNFYFMPAQTTSPGDALADLRRVSAEMPRGEMGQTAALQAMVQQQQSLAGTDLLEGLSFRAGTFNRIDLSSARLTGTEFSGAALRNSDLTRASLLFAALTGADLSETAADSAAFAFAHADSARFANARASGSTWFAARAHHADFKGANLTGAGFAFADLRGAAFDGANLTNAVFLGSDLRGATFAGAVLGSTDFTGSRLDARALSDGQAREACQLEVPVVPEGMYGHVLSVVVIEPITNSRFNGGVEYSRFNESQHLFRLPSNAFGACERRIVRESAWFPLWRNRAGVHVKTDISFRMPHELLEQAGRRDEIRSRISQQLEWLYPFPSGEFIADITAAHIPPAAGRWTGRWSMKFMEDGRLMLDRVGEPPIVANYEKQPRYRFSITGESGPFRCDPTPVDYRWFLTPEGNLKLISYPADGCVDRALVLQAHEWIPRPGPG